MTITTTAQQHPLQPQTASKISAWTQQVLRGTLFVLCGVLWLYTLIVIGLCLFVLIDRTNVSWVEFFKTGVLPGLLTVIPALGLALILRFKWVSLALLFPTLFIISYYVPFFLPKSVSVPPDAPQITVLSFNILGQSRHAEDLAQIILDSGADVVAVQELGVDIEVYLSKALAQIYPYQAVHPQAGNTNYYRGQGVYSRVPIVEDDYWQYDDFPIFRWGRWKMFPSHGHQRVVLDLDGQAVVLYNTHLWPAINWGGGWNFTANDLEDYGHSEAAQRLVERTSQETLPLIWVGDFNMSDQFNEYGDITAYLTDSFRESGYGMGYTYPARGFDPFPALMRLDYVFHSDHLRSLNTRVLGDSGYSDHFPVISTLALVGEG
ncbi:MAG: endonuclease/exonuclease/phosphatase family protein [Aggregatilineales bacterium]